MIIRRPRTPNCTHESTSENLCAVSLHAPELMFGAGLQMLFIGLGFVMVLMMMILLELRGL